MKKRKVAIFATAWSAELLHNYMTGICEKLKEIHADVYLFTCFPALGDSEDFIRGELNIFNLPHLKDFDAAFVVANGLDFPGLTDKINQMCDTAGIPVIYTGKDDEMHCFVGADNYTGAKALAEHLITEHQAKDIFFIAGCQDNADSNARLKALSDVMKEHGLTLSDEQVYYSDWSPTNAIGFLEKWIKEGRKLPDAFVCANDNLAMALCSTLRDNKVDVPKDILVTGFDNEYASSVYDPSISSVNQRFDKIGAASAELFIRLLGGESCARVQTIPCEFVPSESCGCTSAKNFDAIRREIGRNRFLDSMHTSAFNRSLADLERKVLRGHAYADIRENIKSIRYNLSRYEGGCFHIVLDPLFEETIKDSGKHLRAEGYPEKMDVIFSMDENEIVQVDDFETCRIVPFIKNEQESHFFLCLPLHDYGNVMGYTVFGDDIDKLKDTETVQVYQDRLNNILSKYKQTLSVDFLNRKLLELSETDALTHVKNRTAYEARKEELDMLIKSAQKVEFAIVLCDINGLKQVNDNYGHEAGDDYITNSCKLICNTFKRSAIYRIGGDEFVVLLMNSDYQSREKLLEQLRTTMAELREKDLPPAEKVSIASGLSDYDPEQDADVDAVFHRADFLMYENKQFMKQKNN